jgi:hypothetical protein
MHCLIDHTAGLDMAGRALLAARGQSIVHKFAFEYPGFLVGFKGDRANAFAAYNDITQGEPAAFRESFMVFNHTIASRIMASSNQPRAAMIGNAPVPEQCMGPDTLIFTGTGALLLHCVIMLERA